MTLQFWFGFLTASSLSLAIWHWLRDDGRLAIWLDVWYAGVFLACSWWYLR